jgi:hypothetical protein
MNRMFAAATRDGTVAAQLARVLVLLDPPASLMRPRMLWRVMTKGAPVRLSGTSNGGFIPGSFGQSHCDVTTDHNPAETWMIVKTGQAQAVIE